MKRPSSACMSHRGRIQPFDTQAWIDLPKPQLSALPETRITDVGFPPDSVRGGSVAPVCRMNGCITYLDRTR
jgi:hypothetical protein